MLWRILSQIFYFCFFFYAIIFSNSAFSDNSKKSHLSRSSQFIRQAKQLLKRHTKRSKLLAASYFLKAYRLIPRSFRGLNAGARACMLYARFNKKSSKVVYWSKKGWKIAKTIIKKFPHKAEGYLWTSMAVGYYARASGIWVAITQGLAKKIEQMALRSIKINPTLHRGAAQLILGRYYFKLPWPMRKLKKALYYLKECYRQNPNNPSTLLFLAEAYWSNGNKRKARFFYKLCMKKDYPHSGKKSPPQKCKNWLIKHP